MAMRIVRCCSLGALSLMLFSCGDDASSSGTGAGSSGGSGPGAGSPDGGSGGGGGDGAGSTTGGGGSGGAPSCYAFGLYGVPENTFTLPTGASIYYTDIQASFPEVDWTTLDRLYIPAAEYSQILIGNLPERSSDRPLVITNLGGQVKIGPNPTANFIWSMGGGSNWILTGRYDPESQTGDEGFQGHRCEAYANSRGTYGFLSDDAFALEAPYLHMGVAVGDATDFELEFLEITGSGFAGIRLLNHPTDHPNKPMANVRVHDNYVHDIDAEGIYAGWTGGAPSNPMPNFQVYNNRFIRTGNEALQVQNLGEGSRIANNVMLHAGLHWRDNGLGAYQDHNSQIQMRSGAIVVEDNVLIGSAAPLLSLFRGGENGDAEIALTFRRNYFASTRNGFAGYFGGSAGAGSSYAFSENVFRDLAFSYTEVDAASTDPMNVLRPGSIQAAITLTANRWEGSETLVPGLTTPNGTVNNIVAAENTNEAVEPIAFVDSLDVDQASFEFWCAATTRLPGSPARTYAVGDTVLWRDGKLYRATAESTNAPPDENPQAWEELPLPADDVRVVAGSAHAGRGVQ